MNADQTASRPTRASVGLRSERGPVLLAVMLSVGLIAIDATILATAVPTIVSELGGFTQFPWLFSIYLLAQAVTVPVYSKLADLFGRKPVMLFGIVVFLIGSLLCGLAWSMPSLIVFRAVQGIGAGAVSPMGMTIMGDIYTVAERAKAQGYVASVWAMSSLIGPTLGGVFAQYLSWRWIFFVNLPLGLIALWMVKRSYHEQVTRRRSSLDVLGAVLLSVGGVFLLLGLLEGGQQWAWNSAMSIGLFAGAVVLFVGFVAVERRAVDPVLPLWVLGHRVIMAAVMTSLIVGCLMIGLSSYVPLFAERVLGHSPVVGGLALAGMMLGWPIAASQSGRIYLRWGFRRTMLIGSVLAGLGGALLWAVDAESSVVMLALSCFVIGLGFGLVASPSVVVAQSAVEWGSRGVVTGTVAFSRSIGSAVGVAGFGAIVNGMVQSGSGKAPALEDLGPDMLAPALHVVFVVAACLTVLLVLSSLLMPHRITTVNSQ